jgi:hypothetical protein
VCKLFISASLEKRYISLNVGKMASNGDAAKNVVFCYHF